MSNDATRDHLSREELKRLNASLAEEIEERKQAESDLWAQRRQIDAALERTQGDLAQQVLDWREMHAMSTGLLRATTLQDQLSTVLKTVTGFLKSDQGIISTFDAQAGGLVTQASLGVDAAGLKLLACIPVGAGACGAAFQRKSRVIVEDTETDPLFAPYVTLARGQGFRAVFSTPYFDADGQPLGVLSVYSKTPRRPEVRELQLVDICAGHIGVFVERARAESRRQATETALRESDTRMLQLANTIPQLAWMAHADGWIHWYNDRWYEYTGTTAAQMEGWGWQSVHDPETLPLVMDRWPHSIATGEPFQMTFPLRGADGKFRPFFTLVSPLRDAGGNITQWFGSNTDVSPLHEAEQALRKSEQRLQQGLLAGRMAVWDWDLGTDAVTFSSNAAAVIGHVGTTMSAVLGQLHAEDAPKVRQAIDRAVGTGGEFQALARLVRPDDGQLIWVDMRGELSDDADARVQAMRGVIIDVTHRVRAEEELRQADRRKDEFLAMLAHELRNPLAPISNAAQILKTSGIGAEHVRRTSDIISRQVSHMTSLVDDLLDVSRVTRGLVTLDKTPLDLKQVVNSAIEQVRPLIEARRHTLTVRMASDTAHVEGDRTRLVQVVANLLNNAAKYTQQGGEILLGVDVQGQRVSLSVRDNGMGIDAALLPQVFDLFSQGERTPDRSQGGLGLGLALAKSLMELHGGSVQADSEGAGKGSTFTLTLPLIDAAGDPGRSGAEAPVAAPARPIRLMVVDDNIDAAETLAALLGAAGHEVSVRHDGRTALEVADTERHRAFILDIGLPDMDGYELARRFRARPDTADAVLIALTGYGQEHDRVLSRAAGFDFHFVKPVESAALYQVLSQIAPQG